MRTRIEYTWEQVRNVEGRRISETITSQMSEWDWDNGGSDNSLLEFVRVIN